MKIGFSGGDGFVGSHLVKWFKSKGFETICFDRKVLSGSNMPGLCDLVGECDIIINLAGAPISKRWSRSYKRIIRESRITTTHNLVEAINSSERVKLLISTSAVGIYPSNGCYDESNTDVADSFLGSVCAEWEREAMGVGDGVRLVITRFGVVFSDDGGAYPKMIRSYRMGIATTLGSLENHISWIDIRDLVLIFNLIVNNDKISGVVNLTTPHPIKQSHFAKLLAKHYCTIAKLNISPKILQFILGDSHQIMTSNSCIHPTRLQSLDYQFLSPDFESFLRSTKG